jgi:dephospho-CoA kinase
VKAGLRIGLTGGIGSGKSLVADVFMHLGVPVFNADFEAAEILNKDSEVHQLLIAWFGADILAGGVPDRQRIASVVFTEPESLARLNSLIHPRVMLRYTEWLGADPEHPYSIHEAAILFETGFYLGMDKNILVTAPEGLRRQRVMDRDGATRESVAVRMKNQWPDEQKKPLADFIIENDEKTLLVPQILSIHNLLINKSL